MKQIGKNEKIGGDRASNIELFRIITMLFIVAHHYVVNSGVTSTIQSSGYMSWRSLYLLIFGAFGKTGINCFVLITGYFMCMSQITAKKFIKLLLEVEFYNIIIYLIFCIAGYETLSLTSLIYTLLPIRAISTGFTDCYLVFFLFIPFLNVLIKNLSEKQYIKLLALCFAVYVIFATIPTFKVVTNYVSWFIVIYLIGAYIQLYNKKLFSRTRFWGIVTLAVFSASVLSVVFMSVLAELTGHGSIYWFLVDSNKLLAVLLSVSAFIFFKNLKIKNSRFINTVAASSFGVLMIHANSDAMRRWLWQDALHTNDIYNSPWLIPHSIASVVIIYIVCTVIDYLRIVLIEKPVFLFYDKRSAR